MTALNQSLGSLAAALAAYGLYRLVRLIYDQCTSPLRDLPGPKNPSFIYGNSKEIWEAENSVIHEKWVREYGTVFKYKGFLSLSRVYTTDTRALNHILMNNNDYQKPEAARYNLGRIVGAGVVVVEGDKHKQQRQVMNPAFGASHVRELTEIFVGKSIQLRDIWSAQISEQDNIGRVEVLSWLSRMALDVIGLAGFNYTFNALNNDPKQNELNKAFNTIFTAGTKVTIVPMLRAWFPIFRFLPTDRDAHIKHSQATMSRIGNKLLRDSKASIEGTNNKGSFIARDLLSLLVRSNMATGLPESQRMSDQDVLAQVPTFLVAGHETISTATTWALFALTQNQELQTKLRNELLTVSTDNPTMDELNDLPFLDAVVRETLRVHAPISSTLRVAMRDDILPLNNPFMDPRGKLHHELRVKKGQTLMIPILALNRDKSIWGNDSMEFKPDRWESLPGAVAAVPGIWSNILTFLGGPRACIGYRFTLVEMKALIFTLVRAFEFELAVPAKDIIKKASIVQRPVLLTDPNGGNQMPMLIRPYHTS